MPKKKYRLIDQQVDLSGRGWDGMRLGSMRDAINGLVEEFGEDATVTLRADTWGDVDDYAELDFHLTYQRAETDAERDARLALARKSRGKRKKLLEEQEAADRKLYEELKARFE